MTSKTDKTGQERDWGEWQALVELIHSIQNTHQASLEFKITAASSGYVSFVDVDVSASLPILIGPGRHQRLSLLSHYPHPKHLSMASLLLELGRRLDKRIASESYRQRELPLTPPVD